MNDTLIYLIAHAPPPPEGFQVEMAPRPQFPDMRRFPDREAFRPVLDSWRAKDDGWEAARRELVAIKWPIHWARGVLEALRKENG